MLLLWFLLHPVSTFFAKRTFSKVAMFVIRCVAGAGALLAVFHLLGRFVYLAGDWPKVWIAVIGSTVIEMIIALYAAERKVSGAMAGQWILGLRIAAVLCVLLMLLQPIYVRELERRFQRELVILVDDSESMQFTDREPTVSEKLRLAALYEIRAAMRGRSLTKLQRDLKVIEDRLRIESQALRAPEGVSESAASALIARRIGRLREFVRQSELDTRVLQEIIVSERRKFPNLSDASQRLLSDYDTRVRENVTGVFRQAGEAMDAGNYRLALTQCDSLTRQLRFILERLPEVIRELDEAYFASLTPTDQSIITAAAQQSRKAIAERVLSSQRDDGQTILDVLGQTYRLRTVHFGADETDVTAALEGVLQEVPAGDLAGVILLSDGRHNGAKPVDEAVRRLALQDAPLCSVMIGSVVGPRDASVVDVRVPESIFLDDRALIQADLKLDGMTGEEIKVRLFCEDTAIEEEVITVTDSRRTVRFSHTPTEKGIFKYSVRISPLADEFSEANNRRDFEVAVTDDRIDVLLVDGYPRWEFRYLRNLFYGRDKSVHLQYVLSNPDRIEGAPPADGVAASASRPFGESEATALPQSREEWMKFDAIILGDVSPTLISTEDWESIAHAVRDRGALLVAIAGPRYMPHAFEEPLFREMLPIQYEPSVRTQFNSPETAYQLRLTAEGRSSLIMQQSANQEMNEMVWGSLPPLQWRFQPTGVKAGAEVLAYAQPLGEIDERTENALIVSQRYALGKTLMLNFDRTWRLRYGVGDVYHHKFWGQVLRWASGENLRAGNELIRLGTDRLTYAPGEPVKVIAKVLNEYYRPVGDVAIAIGLYQGDKLILRKALKPREESNGIHETLLERVAEPGRYRLVIENTEVTRILNTISQPPVETEFIVEAKDDRVELTELTANSVFLESCASLSGGAVADPDDVWSLIGFLGDPGKIVSERRETSLWDNLGLLALAFGLVTAEWLVRRKAGLT
jgi:hypothetical protein